LFVNIEIDHQNPNATKKQLEELKKMKRKPFVYPPENGEANAKLKARSKTSKGAGSKKKLRRTKSKNKFKSQMIPRRKTL
jgi:hypothetical protein